MAKKKKKPEPEQQEPVKAPGASGSASLLSGSKAHWIFFAVYFLITVILFRAFLFDDVMLFGSDTIPDGIYTRQLYKSYHEQYGGIPRWNPLILGGLPFIDAMHGDTFYPAAWLKFFMPLKRALGHKLIWHVFLAGVFMYLFLRTLEIRREASFIGGIIYMLAPSFVSLLYSGHDAKMYVIAFLPLAFALLESGMNRPRLYKFAGLSAVMGLLILTSHIQMAYYSYWAIGFYFIFRLFFSDGEKRSGTVKKTVLFVLAVCFAVTLGAVQLLPSYKFTTSQSVRAGAERTGYEYATSWSMHPEEVMGMIVPSFPGFDPVFEQGIGNRQDNTYWGKNPFKLNTEYHGVLPVLFAVLALLTCRNKRVWFFLGLALLSLVYSLGAETPMYRLFYALVPGVKNFRAPSMMIFLFCFAISVMAAHFTGNLLDRKTSLRDGDRRLLYAVGALAVIALIGASATSGLLTIWQTIFHRDMSQLQAAALVADIPSIRADLLRVMFFAAAALIGLWMFLSRKIGIPALAILIGLIAFVDESVVDSRFIKVLNPETNPNTAPDRTVNDLLTAMKNKPPFRIFGGLMSMIGMHSPNYYAMFGIQAADGHHNNELQSYELFKGGREMLNYYQHWFENYEVKQDRIKDNNFLRVAGVRYLIIPSKEGSFLLENPTALDRAFVVHDCVVVPEDTLAMEKLKDTSFDPARTAIINEPCDLKPPEAGSSKSTAEVKELAYIRNTITMNIETSAAGLLVLTENYVPYWHADVDGEPVRMYRAYGTFMAVPCPPGSHKVTFTFRSSPYETGKKLTLASLMVIVAVLGISGVLEGIKRKGKSLIPG